MTRPQKPRTRRVREAALEFDPALILRLSRASEELLDAQPDGGRAILRAVRRAWQNELTDCQRKYLLCYYRDTLTMREIAARYGVNIATVSRTLKRARNRLRQVLQYYF